MNYTIEEYTEFNEAEILDLYTSVGWTNYTNNPLMLKNSYANSLKVLGAYDDNKLIGIIRAVGDGYSVIFIQDILVKPEYHRNGIGRALIKKLMNAYRHVYQIHLYTDNTDKIISFYKSLGFLVDTDINCRAFSKFS